MIIWKAHFVGNISVMKMVELGLAGILTAYRLWRYWTWKRQSASDLKDAGYIVRHVGRSYICQSPIGFIYEIKYVHLLVEQLAFANALASSDPVRDEAAEIVATIWQEVAVPEDQIVTEKRAVVAPTVTGAL